MGKNAPEEDEEDGCVIPDAEKDDCNGNPSDRTDRAKDLHDWIDDLIGDRVPAQSQTEWNADNDRTAESYGDPFERAEDVAPEHMLVQQFGQAFGNIPR